MTYRINPTTNKKGLIIVERPHRGCRRVWSAFSQQDALERTQAAAEKSRADLSDFDLSTFDGAMEWNGHDLQCQSIIRFADLTQEMLEDDEEFARECIYLDWAMEVEEEEEART